MTHFPSKQRGLSLIELMVAMALSLMVVAAASYLFLATRESQTKVDQAAGANEVGSYVLRMLGRDVANAGFYPTANAEVALPNVLNGYSNITARPAYDQGIFGCDGASFDVLAGVCNPRVAGAPDTLVIGYFTSDAFGGQGGQRADCEGFDPAAAAVNATRAGGALTSASVAPTLPLFVANHYTLQDAGAPTTMTFDGRTVFTRSLLCKGLVSAGGQPYGRILAGLDDFQVLYGVAGMPASPGAAPPLQFVRADQVAGMGALVVDGVTLPPWKRVQAVRVCVVSRTFEAPNVATSSYQRWQDCDGVTQIATDFSLRKTYSQVFSLRNHLNATY